MTGAIQCPTTNIFFNLVICELKEVNSFVSLIGQMSKIGNILKTKPKKYVLNNSAADS